MRMKWARPIQCGLLTLKKKINGTMHLPRTIPVQWNHKRAKPGTRNGPNGCDGDVRLDQRFVS